MKTKSTLLHYSINKSAWISRVHFLHIPICVSLSFPMLLLNFSPFVQQHPIRLSLSPCCPGSAPGLLYTPSWFTLEESISCGGHDKTLCSLEEIVQFFYILLHSNIINFLDTVTWLVEEINLKKSSGFLSKFVRMFRYNSIQNHGYLNYHWYFLPQRYICILLV